MVAGTSRSEHTSPSPTPTPAPPQPPPALCLPWPSLVESLSAAPAPTAASIPVKPSESRVPNPTSHGPSGVAIQSRNGLSAHLQDRADNVIAETENHQDWTLSLCLVRVTDSLQRPTPPPFRNVDQPQRYCRETAIWSSCIEPVLESLQAFASLASSLPSIPDSNHIALILQPQVRRLAGLIDSSLGELLNPTCGRYGDRLVDMIITPAAIRKAAAHAAVSSVPVSLANMWDQYLVHDTKQALEWVTSSAASDGATIRQALQRALELEQPHRPADDEQVSPQVPEPERAPVVEQVALAADEPAPGRMDTFEAQEGTHESFATIVDPPAAPADADSNLKTPAPAVCDSLPPASPLTSRVSHVVSHNKQPSIPNALSPEALAALSQVYVLLHQSCLTVLARLTSLQPPATLRAELESEIYRARLEHVLWSLYLGQSGGMLADALGQQESSPMSPAAPVLNVMPTLTQVVAQPPADSEPLVLTRSRIPVPVRHVVPPPRNPKSVPSHPKRQRAEWVSLESEDEHVHLDSEDASETDTDTDAGEIDHDDAEYHEPEPPAGNVIRGGGGGGGGSTSLKLPKTKTVDVVPARPRANTLDSISLASSRKPRAPTRAPLMQPPWSIPLTRTRSTSTNASTSTFCSGVPGGRIRPRVSSHRETPRSPSPTPSSACMSSRPRAPPPHLVPLHTSPTQRTLSRPASTPSLLAAMSNSYSTPSLGSGATHGGALGFFPPFIPAGNLGLGDADVAKQRVYNRLSSWHVSGKEADKIAERQAVYEERFRAAAFATVAANRMAGVAGGGKEKEATASGLLDHGDEALHEQGQTGRMQVHASCEPEPAPEHVLSSGSNSRAVSPAAGGVVRSMVEQIEQVQLADEERQRQTGESYHTTSDG